MRPFRFRDELLIDNAVFQQFRRDKDQQFSTFIDFFRLGEQRANVRNIAQEWRFRDSGRLIRLENPAQHHGFAIAHQDLSNQYLAFEHLANVHWAFPGLALVACACLACARLACAHLACAH